MTHPIPRKAILGLTAALCAQLAIVALETFAPMLLVGLGEKMVTVLKAFGWLRMVTTVGVLVSLAQLAPRQDLVGRMAKLGIVASAISLVPWYAALSRWAWPAATVAWSAAPVACWLVLTALTHERGRAVPRLLAFVFALGIGLRIGAAIATTSLLSHGVVTLAFVGVLGTIGGFLVPAAQLALAFPLVPRRA